MTSPSAAPALDRYHLRPVRSDDAPAVLAAHRGQGLAARAAVAVAERALTPSAAGGWGLDRLELGHRANNPASAAVARTAGFVHEGTERGKFLIDGERVDVLTYGRLVTDPAPIVPGLPWST